MNINKKLITFTLSIALIASLSGCGKDEQKATTEASTTEATTAETTTETATTELETSEDMPAEPDVSEPIVSVDEDLNSIIEDSKNAIGQGNYPEPLDVRAIDMTSTDDMMYILGIESLQGMEKGAVAEPMMSSVAFSLAVIKFDSADNASAAASSLPNTAPTEKWLCVMPETVMAKVVNDNYVVFFMGPQTSADALK